MGGPKREDEAYGKAFSTQRREQPPGGWRNRDVGLLAIVFIVTLTVCGGRFADNPPVVQAERFEVRDKNGKVRAIFGLTEDKANMVELVLMDEVGRSRLRLSVDPTGLTGIGVYDPPEHERIGVISVPNGRAGITIREPVGQDCLSIGSREIRHRNEYREILCEGVTSLARGYNIEANSSVFGRLPRSWSCVGVTR